MGCTSVLSLMARIPGNYATKLRRANGAEWGSGVIRSYPHATGAGLRRNHSCPPERVVTCDLQEASVAPCIIARVSTYLAGSNSANVATR